MSTVSNQSIKIQARTFLKEEVSIQSDKKNNSILFAKIKAIWKANFFRKKVHSTDSKLE